ncbi:hypothetical protein P4S72_14960 [Vibrio sp. PP-XX7]
MVELLGFFDTLYDWCDGCDTKQFDGLRHSVKKYESAHDFYHAGVVL